MPINIQITFVHTTDGVLLCQLGVYIYIIIEMTQISATWEVLPLERFLTNLNPLFGYMRYVEVLGYIYNTQHTPPQKNHFFQPTPLP